LSVASGTGFTCGVLFNGTLACWGDGSFTGLWEGTRTFHLESFPDLSDFDPYLVDAPPNLKEVQIGQGEHAHTIFVQDGDEWHCLGSHEEGICGDPERATPVQVRLVE